MTPRCLKCGEAHQTRTVPLIVLKPLTALTARLTAIWPITPNVPYFPSLAKANKLKITTQQLLTASSSGVANSDDQKANILASTLQNNFSENKRPGDGRHPIDPGNY
ncbi:hypothetical protein TNCV_3364771 [Trichonephila clavipes]|nr:hypothetical protein TNCV_3364771 [Trichonephila clavipes]